jgi:hypothetical protein
MALGFSAYTVERVPRTALTAPTASKPPEGPPEDWVVVGNLRFSKNGARVQILERDGGVAFEPTAEAAKAPLRFAAFGDASPSAVAAWVAEEETDPKEKAVLRARREAGKYVLAGRLYNGVEVFTTPGMTLDDIDPPLPTPAIDSITYSERTETRIDTAAHLGLQALHASSDAFLAEWIDPPAVEVDTSYLQEGRRELESFRRDQTRATADLRREVLGDTRSWLQGMRLEMAHWRADMNAQLAEPVLAGV